MKGSGGSWSPIRHEGPPHKKDKCKLGGPTFHRCIDVITLPPLHLLLRVRLLWFVCCCVLGYSGSSVAACEAALVRLLLRVRLLWFACCCV